jgi:branched-chain amino acid transport system ATP-binding protein
VGEPLLITQGLAKRYGGIQASDNISLALNGGELHALIGPNGAGKTTLLGQLAGEIKPDTGTIQFRGHDITFVPVHRRSQLGLARSFQITSIFPEFTALENVALAVQAHAGHSFRFWRDARGDPRWREPAGAVLAQVGLGVRGGVPAAMLSHGEQRQLEIAMALATKPCLVLLDEPMAGLGSQEAVRMVALLRTLKTELTMLLVEHDMVTVFALADRVTVLVYGRIVASGTPAEVRSNREVQRAYLGEDLLELRGNASTM